MLDPLEHMQLVLQFPVNKIYFIFIQMGVGYPLEFKQVKSKPMRGQVNKKPSVSLS